MYSLQIAVLVGIASPLPWLLRMAIPVARLTFWQILLLACLVLPCIRHWKEIVANGLASITNHISGTPTLEHDLAVAGCVVLAAGILLRLFRLGTGLARLRSYHRRALPYQGDTILLSDEILAPGTFGFWEPVILLPIDFPKYAPAVQEAILAHERLHVKRRDWLFSVLEELVRAVFWFHPAIWWVLAEIQLAREQVVDQAVIESTRLPEQYVAALLFIARTAAQSNSTPAPFFLLKRHLKQRVIAILNCKEVSSTQSACTLVSSLAIVATACWLVTSTIPLTNMPANRSSYIQMGNSEAQTHLISHLSPLYPAKARAAGIKGLVQLKVDIGADGKVKNVYPIDGPSELARSAVDAVRQWAYQPILLKGQPVAVTTTVDVHYTLIR
jgi:TonB family protein